jgi:hypothetical protein
MERALITILVATEPTYTGIPRFAKVICSMKTAHKVKICKLKIKFPSTLHAELAKFTNIKLFTVVKMKFK